MAETRAKSNVENLRKITDGFQGLLAQQDAMLSMLTKLAHTQSNNGVHQQSTFSILELPYFTGENPQEWVRKADRYFDLHHTAENQKLEIDGSDYRVNTISDSNRLIPAKGVLCRSLHVKAKDHSEELVNPPKIEDKIGAILDGRSSDSDVVRREVESISNRSLHSSAEKVDVEVPVAEDDSSDDEPPESRTTEEGEDVDDPDQIESGRREINFTILKESDMQERQEDDITRISTVISISCVAATILLRHFNWNVSKVYEEWFADEEKVRKQLGLLEAPIQILNGCEVTCGICFDSYPLSGVISAACGHPFCLSGWKSYIGTSINDGSGGLLWKCPDPSCGASVGQDMINLLACKEDREEYSRYLLRSFVEDSKMTKWCPAPGCEFVVTYCTGNNNYAVTCLCSYGFCWNYMEEAHSPVDCGTVEKRIMKNSAESENLSNYSDFSNVSRRTHRPQVFDPGPKCIGELLHNTSSLRFKFILGGDPTSPWEDLQSNRKTLVVIGICHCPSSPDLDFVIEHFNAACMSYTTKWNSNRHWVSAIHGGMIDVDAYSPNDTMIIDERVKGLAVKHDSLCFGISEHRGYQDQCEYLIAHPECNCGGFFNYIKFFYCDCEKLSVLGYLVLLLWLAALFYLLGNTATDYFCCSFKKLAHLLKLPATVAGVPLLPLRNGSPDVFANIAAFMGKDAGEVSLNSVLGGPVFVTCIVVGTISLSMTEGSITVDRSCFIRDIGFFLFTLISLSIILIVGRINIWGAISFVFLYLVYAIVIAANEGLRKHARKLKLHIVTPLLPVVGSANPHGPEEDDSIYTSLLEDEFDINMPHLQTSSLWGWNDEDTVNTSALCSCLKLLAFLNLPLTLPRRLTILVVEEGGWSKFSGVASALLAPIILAFVWNTQDDLGYFSGEIAYAIGVSFGCILGVLAYLYTSSEQPPRRFLFSWVFGGFAMSIVWFYIVANELVTLLVAVICLEVRVIYYSFGQYIPVPPTLNYILVPTTRLGEAAEAGAYAIADSSSRSDRVEGNWGSILSVFLARSDVPTAVKNEVVPPINNQASAGAEKIGWKIPKASSHNSDKSDVFEPPSFMTLVGPGRAGNQHLADFKIQHLAGAYYWKHGRIGCGVLSFSKQKMNLVWISQQLFVLLESRFLWKFQAMGRIA